MWFTNNRNYNNQINMIHQAINLLKDIKRFCYTTINTRDIYIYSKFEFSYKIFIYFYIKRLNFSLIKV